MTLLEYKKAFLKYAPLANYAAGIELTGGEVKALRGKQGSLEGSRVVVRGGEAFIVGMTIPAYQSANVAKSYDSERSRRLLLAKREIAELADAEAKKGLTIIPVEIYSPSGSSGFLKARVSIVRGKNKADKREDLKRKEADRERARVLKAR